eukprot:12902969-Ditylum_brightwellii.AAC.1
MKSLAAQHNLNSIKQLKAILEEPEPITTEEESKWSQLESYAGMPVPEILVNRSREDRAPISWMIAQQVQWCESRRLLKVLFDSGGNGSMIHARELLPNVSPVVN